MKPDIKIFFWVMTILISGCKHGRSDSAGYSTSTPATADTTDTDYYEYTVEGLSDNYVGKYDMKEVFKRKNWNYKSVYDNGPYWDSLREERTGYTGFVKIYHLTNTGFDFWIEVIDFGHCNGGVRGKASFDTINLAYSVKCEGETDGNCLLTFTFLKDTLLLNQQHCTEFHGASCQFEGEYVLKNRDN